MNEKEILDLIEKDPWMMEILRVAEKMNLPDWLIGAGFVRNKVWDHLHGYKNSTPPTDIDFVYFDKNGIYEDKKIEAELSAKRPDLKWEVVNQATIHEWNQEAPYISTADAISKWPETATGVGVSLENGKLRLVAPLGIKDLVEMVVRPTPAFMASEIKRNKVRERIEEKRWKEKWPKLTFAPF